MTSLMTDWAPEHSGQPQWSSTSGTMPSVQQNWETDPTPVNSAGGITCSVVQIQCMTFEISINYKVNHFILGLITSFKYLGEYLGSNDTLRFSLDRNFSFIISCPSRVLLYILC